MRRQFGGEVVCHSDPLQKRTAEVIAVEKQFSLAVTEDPRIKAFHDFRIISETKNTILIVADIDTEYHVPESEFDDIAKTLEMRTLKMIPNLSYCSFYVTPKFAY